MDDTDFDQFIEKLCVSADEEIEFLVDQFIIRHANQRVKNSPQNLEAFNRKLRVRILKLLSEERESNEAKNAPPNPSCD